MEHRIKVWILAGLAAVIISIASWLAIQLYNASVKQTDLIERKLIEVHNSQIQSNNSIIRLEAMIKSMESENDKVHNLINNEIDILKDTDQTFWQILIENPYRKKVKK